MGCNCKEKNRDKRKKIEKLNKELLLTKNKQMAKYLYKVVDGVDPDARLNFRKNRILVKTASQDILKLLYESGHPQVEKIEKSEKKKDK